MALVDAPAANRMETAPFGCAAKGAAFVRHGDRAAATRQRLLQFGDYFRQEGIELAVSPLFSNTYLDRLYADDRRSLHSVLQAYWSRLADLIAARDAQFLWVYAELFPYLPGWSERVVKALGVPVIYDFDDAFFHQYDRHSNPAIRRLLGRKLEPALKSASLAVCGNRYLADYAGRFCRRTEIVPTVVDTSVFAPSAVREIANKVTTVGWIGSPSTWKYVLPFVPLLQSLAGQENLRISAVGAGYGGPRPRGFEFRAWTEEDEVALIQEMDIGIMPLPDEPWARGKCGYKLIQYMACGLPVIASPVGVNSEIVEHGVNGFLAESEREWADAIRRLAADPQLRRSMGMAGRKTVERRYSLSVQGPRLARMVRQSIDRPGNQGF